MIPTVTFVITCITAVISFVTLTVKLTRYITKAESKIDATGNELHDFEKAAVGEHKEMWDKIDDHGKHLTEHDIWIAKHDVKEKSEMEDGK